MAKVITIVAEKGGVGKTTLAVNLASILASHSERPGRNKKVLLIDADEQCNASLAMGISLEEIIEFEENGKTNCSRLFGDKEVDMETITLDGLFQELDNLNLIPGSYSMMRVERNLSRYSEDWIDAEHNIYKPLYTEAMVLKEAFERNRDFINSYDYVVIDTKPSLSQVNECAYMVADTLIAVTDPSLHGLYGLEMLFNTWNSICEYNGYEQKYNEAIVLNRYNKNSAINRTIYAILTGDRDKASISDNMWDMFSEYSKLFVDAPIKESEWLLRRSAQSTPLCVDPNFYESKLLETLEDTVDKLYEGGLL